MAVDQQVILVNSASHGLVTLDVVKYSSGGWTKAQADSLSNLSDPPSIIADHSTDWFIVLFGGIFSAPSHGLTVDSVYYLSESTSGLLTNTEGSSFSNPIVKVMSPNDLMVLPYRPQQII